MRGTWLTRTVVGLAAALLVGVAASPAWAVESIGINPGNVPTTAVGFSTHQCDPNQGGGPIPGMDVWVFVLPGNHSDSGDFLSVTAYFLGHGSITITRAANPGNFSDISSKATSKAWIIVPAGWTLTGATAVISGTADFFNLTHTCPAPASPSSTPTGPRGGSPTPVMSQSASASASASMSGSPSASASEMVPASVGASVVPSGAAQTGGGGSQGGGLLYGVLALVLAGVGGAGALLTRRWRLG
jgi:hypothetical protein